MILGLKLKNKHTNPDYTIYTDGSSRSNPGPAGCAFVILDSSQNIIHKFAFIAGITTNNRMEMYGVILALNWVKKNLGTNHTYEVNSDSNLVVSTLNLNWKKNKNQDLWQELDEARKGLNVSFKWVKGHSTNKFNNLCDKLATKAADLSAKKAIKTDLTLKSLF